MSDDKQLKPSLSFTEISRMNNKDIDASPASTSMGTSTTTLGDSAPNTSSSPKHTTVNLLEEMCSPTISISSPNDGLPGTQESSHSMNEEDDDFSDSDHEGHFKSHSNNQKGKEPHLNPNFSQKPAHHLKKNTEGCTGNIPQWLVRLLLKLLLVIILLIPGLLDLFVLSVHPLIFDFSLYFWSFFVSMQVAFLFLYRYLIYGIFRGIGKFMMNSDNTKVKERIEKAAMLRNEISTTLFSYSTLAFWTIQLQNECLILKDKCKNNESSSCFIPSICNGTVNPPTPGSLMIKFLGGFSIACTFYLFERTLFQMISFNFHSSAYKDRIEHSRFAAWALDKLNNARKAAKKIKTASNRHSDNQFSILSTGSQKNTTMDLKNLWKEYEEFQSKANLKSSPASPLDDTPHLERKHTVAMKEKFNGGHTGAAYRTLSRKYVEEEEQESIFFSSSAKAKLTAIKLYHFLVSPGESSVTLEDVRPHFENNSNALRTFEVFDKDGNGSISMDEMKSTVLNIYKERRRLVVSITDVENALKRLHHIMLTFFSIIVMFIWLALFDVNVTVIFTTSATMLVAVAFVIGTSAKNAFESIIFLFVVHPYDVGDRVFVRLDGTDFENLIVHNLNLLNTVFRRWDGTEIYIPNHIMATKQIQNMRRSGDQWDSLKIEYDFQTPPEVIQAFKARLSNWLKNPKGGGKDFHPNFLWFMLSVAQGCQLTVQICVQHRKNWQDGVLRWNRREKFINFIQDAFKCLDIKFAVPVQPLVFAHSVTGDLFQNGIQANLQNNSHSRSRPTV